MVISMIKMVAKIVNIFVGLDVHHAIITPILVLVVSFMDLLPNYIIVLQLKMMVLLLLILMDMLGKFVINLILVIMMIVVYNRIFMANINVNNLQFVQVV